MSDNTTNLIINYLPQQMTERELYSMFITIGQCQCKIMKDNKTGYSYGFGFVNYINSDDAARAIEQLNGIEIYNKRIKVSYARPSTEDIKETNLYVTRLPRTYNENDLENLFGQYGKIVQKNLLLDKFTKIPRGVAFVRFDKREEAKAAIEGLNGYTPDGSIEPLVVKVAEEHGKQKAAYLAGFQAGYQQTRASRGRGMMRGGGGSNIRGPRNNNYGNNDLISYPLGALRQKTQQRFNPMFYGSGMTNDDDSTFQ